MKKVLYAGQVVHPIIGKKINIRLNGVDTPEIRTKSKCEKTKARTARKLVGNLLKNAKRIDLKNIKRGKYFRIAADIEYDGKNLASILIKNKLAYEYYGGKKKKGWGSVNKCRYQSSAARYQDRVQRSG